MHGDVPLIILVRTEVSSCPNHVLDMTTRNVSSWLGFSLLLIQGVPRSHQFRKMDIVHVRDPSSQDSIDV